MIIYSNNQYADEEKPLTDPHCPICGDDNFIETKDGKGICRTCWHKTDIDNFYL